MTSGDKIRYFLEEDAVDKDGKLTRDKSKAVNKIGHGLRFLHVRYQGDVLTATLLGLHELDPVFRRVTLQNDKMKALVRDLQFHRDPVGRYNLCWTCLLPCRSSICTALQSMVITKQPQIGGEGKSSCTTLSCISKSLSLLSL